ncbi:hypothetical protein ACO0SA_004741 [Hanseniaspora valbyensis]
MKNIDQKKKNKSKHVGSNNNSIHSVSRRPSTSANTIRSSRSNLSNYYSETEDPFHDGYEENDENMMSSSYNSSIDSMHHRRRRDSVMTSSSGNTNNHNIANFNYFSNDEIINTTSYSSTQTNMDIVFQDEREYLVHSETDTHSNLSRLGNKRHKRRDTFNTFVRPPTTYGSVHSLPLSVGTSTSGSYSEEYSHTEGEEEEEGNGIINSDSDNMTNTLIHHGHYNNNDNSSFNENSKKPVKYTRKNLLRFFRFNSREKKTFLQRLYIAEEDLVLGIQGLAQNKFKLIIFYILSILTLGILPVICHWFPKMKISLMYNKSELFCSDKVIIETELGQLDIISVKREWYDNKDISTVFNYVDDTDYGLKVLTFFSYRFFKLYYDPLEDLFKVNTNWFDIDNWLDYNNVQQGLNNNNIIEDRLLIFGKNSCDLDIKPIHQLIFEEALHPFFVFQIFSMILWAYDDYLYYALCILIISVFSVAQTVYETRQSALKLQKLAHSETNVRVFRNGFWLTVASEEVVPGDILDISDPNLNTVPCDCLLLNGQVLVNESMLSGESIPVNKKSCNSDSLLESFFNNDLSKESKYKLYNGTEIINTKPTESNPQVTALCLSTGFNTTKGSLIRSMVFPSTSTGNSGEKDMTKQAYKYIFYMTLLALFGFIFSAINFKRLHLSTKLIIVRALDIVTIVVPPGLPATLSVAVTFSISRLKNKCNIFCIRPTKINGAGGVSVWVFDKTGTLTGEGLVVKGIIENNEDLNDIGDNDDDDIITSNYYNLKMKMLRYCLTCCHSSALVVQNGHKSLIGDPLDLEMFRFTKGKFSEKTHHDGFVINDKYHVVKTFEFDSHLRRMGVIMEKPSKKEHYSLVKGSPESIASLCNPHTIPQVYDHIVKKYAHQGYRLIALAGKNISQKHNQYSIEMITREEAEEDLHFLGFIIFENKIKPESKPTILELKNANIPSIMCTGDNILTAISVANDASILEKEEICFVPIWDNIKEVIHWESVDNPEIKLDDTTLIPLDKWVSEKGYSLALTGDVFNEIFGDNANIASETEDSLENVDNNIADSNADEDFAKYSSHYKQTILLKSKIFARMSPDDKEDLVNQLQSLDHTVGFCGDGANDVGALRSSDCGVSLSEAEASIAAPFTSQIFNISCVLNIMKEGRCSIVTSFACFQYMSLYSAIQFITVTILYGQGANLGDFQFLYIDMCLIIPIAITMSWSSPNYGPLVAKRPSMNLVSLKILVPILINVGIILVGQLVPWIISKYMPWYTKPIAGDQDTINSTDNTVLFLVSSFQYIYMSIILTQGPPYREPIHENSFYIINVLICLVFSVYLLFGKFDSYCGKLMQLTYVSFGFKVFLLLWCVLGLVAHSVLPKRFNHRFKKGVSSKKYKRLLQREDHMSV